MGLGLGRSESSTRVWRSMPHRQATAVSDGVYARLHPISSRACRVKLSSARAVEPSTAPGPRRVKSKPPPALERGVDGTPGPGGSRSSARPRLVLQTSALVTCVSLQFPDLPPLKPRCSSVPTCFSATQPPPCPASPAPRPLPCDAVLPAVKRRQLQPVGNHSGPGSEKVKTAPTSLLLHFRASPL